MNILQLCNKPPYPPTDGGSVAISVMTRGFAEMGHKVFVLAIVTPKHFTTAEAIKPLIPENVNVTLVNINAGVSMAGALMNLAFSDKPYHVERFYSERFEEKLIQVLQQSCFDVVMIEGLYVSSYIPVIRKLSHAIIAYRAHNIESEIWGRFGRNEKNILKRFYFGVLSKRLEQYECGLLNKIDALIPTTQRDATTFNNCGNTKPTFVAPVGIKTDQNKYPSKASHRSVCYIGSLDWMPNQEGLIWFIRNVWPLIVNEDTQARMYVAGRNAPAWLVKRLNSKNVNFVGEVTDAYEFLSQHAIMIVPLFSGSGMRVKILEGLYLGKAIVATSIGAEGIETVHGENILIADTAVEFAGCILQLLKNKKLYEKICINARDLIIEKYNNTEITTQLIEFFERL